MDTETINRLNAINRAFYTTVADDFDQTRGAAWPGRQRLLPYLPLPLSVLDVGCGNGRFALFLHDNLAAGQPRHNADAPLLSYHGLDSNPALLAHAHNALAGKTSLSVTLEERDVVENPPDSGEYD